MGKVKAKHYSVAEILKIKRDAVGEACDRATLCCLLALRDEFGFGEKKTSKVFRKARYNYGLCM